MKSPSEEDEDQLRQDEEQWRKDRDDFEFILAVMLQAKEQGLGSEWLNGFIAYLKSGAEPYIAADSAANDWDF